MPQQQSPFLEGKYGWSYGENGWNSGMDENLLKFSYMFDGNVDGLVSSLPAVSNGLAYFNTSDKRLYFAVGTVWYSSPCPKHFIFKNKSNGDFYQYNGTSAIQIDNPAQIDNRLDAVELTISTLGSAAFEDVSAFATQTALDVLEGQTQAYTDDLRSDLSNTSTGATNVGYNGTTVSATLNTFTTQIADLTEKTTGFLHASEFDLLGDGSDETTKVQNAVTAASTQRKLLIGDRTKTYKITSQITGASNCHIKDFSIDASAMTGTKHALVFQGSLGTSSNLTSDVTVDTFTAAVVDGSIYAVDEWVLLHTETSYYAFPTYNVAKGEYLQIRSISGNTLTFTTPIMDSYTTAAGGKVHKVNFVENVKLEGVKIRGSNTAASNERGICLRFAKDCEISSCYVSNIDQYCYELDSVLKTNVFNNQIRGTFYDGVTGTIFYGFAVVNACQELNIHHNFSSRVRHHTVSTAFSAGNGRYGQPSHINVNNNIADDCMAGGAGRSFAYEVHGTGRHQIWANNWANGCYSFMRLEGGSDIQVIGGGCNGYAYQGLILGGASQTLERVLISNVRLCNYTAEVTAGLPCAIRLEGSTLLSGITIDGVKIERGAVSNVGTAISVGTSTTSRNIRFKNISASAGTVESTGTAVATATGVNDLTFESCDLFGWRGGYNFSGSKCAVNNGVIENFAIGGSGFAITSSGDRNTFTNLKVRNINTFYNLTAASTNNLVTLNRLTDMTSTTGTNAGAGNVVSGNFVV